VDATGLLETGGLFPLAALEVVELCATGDAFAGALLNGFIVMTNAETTTSPTSTSTE